MIRVLAVDHTAGIGPFRRKHSALAALPGIELTVLSPSLWVENYRPVRAEPGTGSGFRMLTGTVIWPGYENRGFFTGGMNRAFRESKPDLLHLWEEPYSFIAFQTLMAARSLAPQARVIFSSSDDRSVGFRYPYRPSRLYGAIERFTLKRAHGAIAINMAVRDLLKTKGFQRPVEIIPHGLDLEDYPRRVGASASQSGRGRPVIGYFGRLTRQKGIDVLIESLALLSDLGGSAPLLRIVGEGPEREDLVALARKRGVGDRVEFQPAVPHTDAPRVLSEFDVLVLPSRTTPTAREQFGRVLIEGMAAGCVVIGSNSGAIPEVIADAGIVFPEDDPEALTAGLTKALADRELAAGLRSRGLERVRERHVWSRIAGRLAEFYGRVLQEPRTE